MNTQLFGCKLPNTFFTIKNGRFFHPLRIDTNPCFINTFLATLVMLNQFSAVISSINLQFKFAVTKKEKCPCLYLEQLLVLSKTRDQEECSMLEVERRVDSCTVHVNWHILNYLVVNNLKRAA